MFVKEDGCRDCFCCLRRKDAMANLRFGLNFGNCHDILLGSLANKLSITGIRRKGRQRRWRRRFQGGRARGRRRRGRRGIGRPKRYARRGLVIPLPPKPSKSLAPPAVRSPQRHFKAMAPHGRTTRTRWTSGLGNNQYLDEMLTVCRMQGIQAMRASQAPL